MKKLKKKIVDLLIAEAKARGLDVDANGYVNSIEDNLITEFTAWDQIEIELKNGDGNELVAKGGGKPNFYALHSSAALCVNNFAIFKEQSKEVSFLGEKFYNTKRFEMKLNTGISHPNLDFFLESEKSTIGIESKFLETLERKNPKNLDKYINRRKEIDNIPEELFELIQFYITSEYLGYLDVAQLIKHSIGLIRRSSFEKTKPKLVYIYWTPEDDGFLPTEFKKHKLEVEDFSNKIKPFIDFIPMRYEDFWQDITSENNFDCNILKLMGRYQIPSAKLD
jgi:hypothetical protein